MNEEEEEGRVVDGDQNEESTTSERYERVDPANLVSGNPKLALGAAFGAAVVGALVWAAISFYGDMEIGWVAWGIGGLTGAACVAGTGRGRTMAISAAVLAVLAIAGGKVLSIKLAISKSLNSAEFRQYYDNYEDTLRNYIALGDAPSEKAAEEYMLAYDLADVTVEEFIEQRKSESESLPKSPLTIEEWRTQFEEEAGISEILIANLELFDLLWLVLGVGTAFGMVMKKSAADVSAMQKTRRKEA